MDTTKATADQPYTCTLCGKVHRPTQQSRGFGTDRYSLHREWRVGGPQDKEARR